MNEQKQIQLLWIMKIQQASVRLFEALDEDFPNGKVVKANERAIEYWLDKITNEPKERAAILDIIEHENWNTADLTYKPICDKLRVLGYEIMQGGPKVTKYTIENEEWGQIICKPKNGGRHYRQSVGYIDKGLVVVKTTKGRAERERDYLNENYYKGWEIVEETR